MSARISLYLFILVSLFACNKGESSENTNLLIIEVTGEAYNWHFRYPGLDGVLGTTDDKHSIQNLYLPIDTNVQLKLKSKDYIYSFALPELGQKEIAVPDLDFQLQFRTGKQKTLEILGDQFCGYAHKSLIGKAFISHQVSDFYILPK